MVGQDDSSLVSSLSYAALSKSGLQSHLSSSSCSGVFAGDGRFQLCAKVGSGAFGQVYQAVDLVTSRELAVKLVKNNNTLVNEYKAYCDIGEFPGIPNVTYKGEEGQFEVLAMELLGPNLQHLYEYCCQQFSLKTLLMLGEQILHILQHVHSMGYIHRDIKPENFAMGLGQKGNYVYLIDYGIAKRYRDLRGLHIPFIQDKAFIGTTRYASIGTHLGYEQSRKDDLESLCYIMGHLSGSLPWQGIKARNKIEKREAVLVLKKEYPDSSCPSCFSAILKHAQDLLHNEDPDYTYMLGVLKDTFVSQGYTKDFAFDWFDHVDRYRGG